MCPLMRDGMVTYLLFVTFELSALRALPMNHHANVDLVSCPQEGYHISLSYGSSTGVYRLISPNNGIVLSKHVVFNESAIVTGHHVVS